jgi:MFS transporter, UMF1 family
MRTPGWLNRQVFGWAMFDFANQAFTLVILTAMFNVYFIEHVVGDLERGMYLWSASGITAQIVIMILAPILGALADFSGAKKKLLFVTYIGCVVCTAALGLITPGAVGLAMALFILAYLFYAGGENFMASFLPELAPHRVMGRVSAFGWTMGYVGGLLCLAGAAFITWRWDGATGYRLVSLWAAAFFFAAALPTFLLLTERKRPEVLPPGHSYWTIGFVRLRQTFRAVRAYRRLFHFLMIMTLYFAGVQVVFWFAGTLTRQLFGFSAEKMGLFLIQITATAIVGAVITGRVQDRIGAKTFIMITLAFWAITVLAAACATREWTFWVVGNAVGLGLGAIGTSSRAMVGLFSPAHKAAEFFGFYGLAHKLSAIIGLSSIGFATFIFEGNLHLVVGAGSSFFILGFLLMLAVDEKAGRVIALRAERDYHRGRLAGHTPVYASSQP